MEIEGLLKEETRDGRPSIGEGDALQLRGPFGLSKMEDSPVEEWLFGDTSASLRTLDLMLASLQSLSRVNL